MMRISGGGGALDRPKPQDVEHIRASGVGAHGGEAYPVGTGVGPMQMRRLGDGMTRRGRTSRMAFLFFVTLAITFALVACGASARGGSSPSPAASTRARLTVAYVLSGDELVAYVAATGRRLWSFAPAQPAAMPSLVLHDGVLYLSDGSLYALKASDGRPLWQTPLSAGGMGALESTLQFARGALYLAANGVVSAVSARDGMLLWHTQVGSGLDTLLVDAAQGTSGTIYDGSGGLTALRANDGSQVWQIGVQGSGISSLQLVGDSLYAGTTDNRLLALDPTDGRLRWSYQDPTIQALSRPTIAGSMIYLAAQATAATTSPTGSIGVQMLETVVALRANDGAQFWQRQLSIGLPASAVTSALGPVVSGDGSTVYAVAGPTAGDVVALATANGATRWQAPSNDTVIALLGASRDVVYTGGVSGSVVALSATSGTPRWRASVEQISPVVRLDLERSTLYAATADGTCAALDPSTGSIRWRTPAGSDSAAGSGLVPPTIIVADISA